MGSDNVFGDCNFGVQILSSGAGDSRSSTCAIPISMSSLCWSVSMLLRWSMSSGVRGMLSAVRAGGLRVISIPSSSWCCSRLSASKLGVSSVGLGCGPS